MPFFAFPEGVRRIIYTTNAIRGFELQAAPRRQDQSTSSI
jgi:transposase-like protein